MRETFIRFFTIADYEEEEAWLRAQHRSGLRLVRAAFPCFYIFEHCPPADVIYRLEFGSLNGDALEMYRDYGWSYIAGLAGWHFFRKPACEVFTESDGALFSDSASKLEMIRRIVKTRLIPIVLLCWLAILMSACATPAAGPFFGILSRILLGLDLGLVLYCGLKLRKLKRRLERG